MKRSLIYAAALLLAVMPVLSACGAQESGSVPIGGPAGIESSADAAVTADGSKEEARQMRFELSDEANDELQRLLDEQEGSGVFWIDPVRC